MTKTHSQIFDELSQNDLGEKLHEEMITDRDSLNTIDLGKYYAIFPSISFMHTEEGFITHHKAVKVPFGFKYNSGTNTQWETIESLRQLMAVHVASSIGCFIDD